MQVVIINMANTKKVDGKTLYKVPKGKQSTNQKKNNDSDWFEKKYLTKEQKEFFGI